MASAVIPQWSLADRLAKARHVTGMTQHELADTLGVSVDTVKRYEGDNATRRRVVILAWALACGVDAEWLESGTVTDSEPVSPGMSFTGRYMAA